MDRRDATETPMNKDNVKHVYEELTGKIDHDRLGLRPDPAGLAGASPRPRDRRRPEPARCVVSDASRGVFLASPRQPGLPAVVFFDKPENYPIFALKSLTGFLSPRHHPDSAGV